MQLSTTCPLPVLCIVMPKRSLPAHLPTSCSQADMWYAHVAFGFLAFFAGMMCFITRCHPILKPAHVWWVQCAVNIDGLSNRNCYSLLQLDQFA